MGTRNGDQAWRVLWAKTRRDGPAPHAMHPLACHLVDAAAVAEAWFEAGATPRLRRLIAEALGVAEEDHARRLLAFLVGAHDIGKAVPPFQMLWPEAVPVLAAAGLRTPSVRPLHPPPHGACSAAVLAGYLEGALGWPPDRAGQAAFVVGAHHGVVASHSVRATVDRLRASPAYGGTAAWTAARVAILDRLANVTGVRSVPPPLADDRGLVLLAGLASVLDWIASLEEVFGYACASADAALEAEAPDLLDYADRARRLAPRALDVAGLRAPAPRGEARSFADLFPTFDAPRPAQAAAEAALAGAAWPFLLVVEDAMGAGKTEIAWLALEHGAAQGARGSYVALPTRATSDQAYRRLRDFLTRTGTGERMEAHLVHGTAGWNAEYLAARRTAEALQRDRLLPTYDDDDEAHPSVVASAWFARAKRGLLAEHAVGTVDQGLLGVLHVRHWWVRLFGLAGKVVVLDEVHAYDTYMGALLEQLVEWLAALDCAVVLLSATLPTDRRRQLERAFARGRGDPDEAARDADAPPPGYPRIAVRSAAGAAMHPVDGGPARTLAIEWVDGDLAGAAERVRREAAGCVAIVCNTVTRAQRLYDELVRAESGTADDGRPIVQLFTSRLRVIDRAAVEEAVRARFGPSRDGAQRPERAVLVATQVVEQSLDVDFDLLVSDFAPVDLLLQRAGRCHRHAGRRRPERLREPTIAVLRPRLTSGEVVFCPGATRVYDEHVLVRSFDVLRHERSPLTFPGDIDRLVQRAYGAGGPSAPDLVRAWATTAEAHAAREQQERAAAKTYRIPPPGRHPFASLAPDGWPDDEDSEVGEGRTRLGAASTTVVLLFAEEQHLLAGGRARVGDLLARSISLPPWATPATPPPPPAWQEIAPLRRARLVLLGDDGSYTDEDGRTWNYTADRGWSATRT